jgi:hypothetical protein
MRSARKDGGHAFADVGPAERGVLGAANAVSAAPAITARVIGWHLPGLLGDDVALRGHAPMVATRLLGKVLSREVTGLGLDAWRTVDHRKRTRSGG